MRSIALVCLTAAALLAGGAAQAQKMRPGLWENSVSMKSAGGEMDTAMARMREEMARMTPEQRKQMETMMGGQGLAMAQGQPPKVRVCVSAEQAARQEMPSADDRCKQTSQSPSGNTMRFKFICSGGDMAGSGEGEFTFVSDTEHRGKMMIEAMRQGKPTRMEMQTAGRWIQADCGNIKPRP